MLIESSKDVLYLVISLCVLWATVFLCWMFYYVVRILKNANQITEEFRMRLQGLTEAINYVRSKVEYISSAVALAGSGVSGLVKKVVTRKAGQWLDNTSAKMNFTAKEAVERAVEATSKKMKKMTKKIKKK